MLGLMIPVRAVHSQPGGVLEFQERLKRRVVRLIRSDSGGQFPLVIVERLI